MFQITRNGREHDVDVKDLRRLDNLKVPSDTRRHYVVVTPESVYPKVKVPAKYVRGQGQQETSDDEDLDEGMLIEEDEEMLADKDEEVPADGDEKISVDENEELWSDKLSQVFYHPVRMTELFGFRRPGKRDIHFVPGNYSRCRTVMYAFVVTELLPLVFRWALSISYTSCR